MFNPHILTLSRDCLIKADDVINSHDIITQYRTLSCTKISFHIYKQTRISHIYLHAECAMEFCVHTTT
jgi:hypothetical protein